MDEQRRRKTWGIPEWDDPMPTTSRYRAKKKWNQRLRTYLECPKKGKLVDSNLDEKSLATSAAALNARSQGNNGFTLLLKMLDSGIHMGQIIKSNVKIKTPFGRWGFRNPLSLLYTLIKEIFLVKKNED